MRERRPGVWEIRVAAGTDPVTGRTLQRSVTFRGTAGEAELYRVELAAEYQQRRAVTRAAPLLTVDELLVRWLAADHPWKPSTVVGYRSNARQLAADATLARTHVLSLTPQGLRRAFARWEAAGVTPSVIGGRFRVLRSAVGWAYDQRIIDHHPIRSITGPSRPEPRRPLADGDLAGLLATAETLLLEALANDRGDVAGRKRRHDAEVDMLLVRVAADSGARRGELAALRFDDLDQRILHIARSVSAGTITTPKPGHGRVLTLGSSTARLWHGLHQDWRQRSPVPLGSWVLSRDPDHHTPFAPEALGKRFNQLRTHAQVPEATLHRLRHNVATLLVSRGQILQAQARLGHRDAATTLRVYAHALPLADTQAADTINDHLDNPSAQPCGSDDACPAERRRR
jgi:integrase